MGGANGGKRVLLLQPSVQKTSCMSLHEQPDIRCLSYRSGLSTEKDPLKMLPLLGYHHDINIHFARGFQPVGYLSASTRAI